MGIALRRNPHNIRMPKGQGTLVLLISQAKGRSNKFVFNTIDRAVSKANFIIALNYGESCRMCGASVFYCKNLF